MAIASSRRVTAAGAHSGRAADALMRAREHLLSLQSDGGWFKGELETNVTMDSEDLLLREFLGVRTDDVTRLSANWIRSQQRPDGTWSNFFGGPGDVSTTTEAYIALRLAGDPLGAEHMRAARAFILDHGGLERTRVFTRIWCALFGLWPWSRLPVLPVEIMLLPPWFPLNIYDFACWARQTIAALAVVYAYRPERSIPIAVDELRTGAPDPPPSPLASWEGAFERLDKILRRYQRWPLGSLRSGALRKAERWIVERQEADGGWGGIQPPWVYSMMALNLRGYAPDHPVMRKALRGLDGFTIIEGDTRRLEACQSPVWDTALALIALTDAGVPSDDPRIAKAAAWLNDEEIGVRGDWSVRRKELPPGGWAFEFANDWYPDVDDTAEVVMALRRTRPSAAIERGVNWVLGMRSSDGGWAAFDADNVRTLCRRIPFCDFGEVLDPPSADVTAHVVEMLAEEGLSEHPFARAGVKWLLDHQEPDGSWFGRWGCNYVYGAGAALPALVKAGVHPRHRAVRRAVAWLERAQNADGGWGEDMRSYDDRSWAGRGDSTASQTAWALLALIAAGEGRSQPARRGVDWLVATQRGDGAWDEPQYTGTGFPGHFYINYHLYRLTFPIMALGRYLEGGRNDA
ncbi:MAG TPA: squalene--hopene cyclase [Actinomycetota bacterium]|jgi:squalene-hopene/tetraprenyl-beta-curcumene cyclase|nr:squalene--hopene cyclase [Actinomycetota bacterium]